MSLSDKDINIMNIKLDKERTKMGSFDYAVAINFWCMRMVGVWPLKNTLYSNLQCGLIVILISLLSLSITIELLMIREWNVIIRQAILTIPWIPVIGRFVFMKVFMSKNFRIILHTMIADWKDYRCLPKRNQQIMVYYARKSRMLNIFSITLMGFSLAGYMLTPIINTWNSDVPWNTTTRSLPIRGFFPFSFKESPVFEILYTMQSIVGFFACTMIVSIDCFLCTVMLHACGQFDILAATLERYDSSTRHDYTKDMRSRTCACLSCFVKRHVHILKYMDIVQRSFSDFHLIQLLTYCFNLVLCGHQLITYFQDHNFYDFITFIIYVLTITCIIFIYCYLSECVMEKSKNIGTIAYNLEWCRFPRDSNLAIIIARSRIPCKITAGKFVTMSFSYFTTIIISIISYISVLAAFK